MKVYKNDPIEPNIVMESYNDGMVKRKTKGAPIRLVIAAQVLAQTVSHPGLSSPEEAAKYALEAADALIEEHNRTYENLDK
jgi:hypothetical protein